MPAGCPPAWPSSNCSRWPLRTRPASSNAARLAPTVPAGSWSPPRSGPGPLARALSSPLMTGLIRPAYAGQAEAAAALAAHGDAGAIEDRILDALVITRFSQRATSEHERPRRPVNPADADRWLAFLAAHLARDRSYELDWPRLRHALPAFGTPLRWAALGGGLAWLLAGTLFGVSRGLVSGAAAGALA